MLSFRTITQLCPLCEHVLDAASAVDGERGPQQGDATVCVGCAAVLEFGENLVLREGVIESYPEEAQKTLRIVVEAVQKLKKGEIG